MNPSRDQVTTSNVERMRELEKAATISWRRDDDALGGEEKTICDRDCVVVQTCTNKNSRDMKLQLSQQDADLDLIVAMRSTLPALLEIAEAAEKQRSWQDGNLGDLVKINRELDEALAKFNSLKIEGL